MFKRFKYIFMFRFAVVLILSYPRSVQSQDRSGSILMSSVGSIQNLTNSSIPVTFASKVHCFNVQSGAAVIMSERGVGPFAITCEVNTVFNSLGIKLYPNPVGANAKVKFITEPTKNTQFSINVWNNQGEKINTINASGYEIYQGKLLNMSSLIAGSYMLEIESDQYRDVIKFIKKN